MKKPTLALQHHVFIDLNTRTADRQKKPGKRRESLKTIPENMNHRSRRENAKQ